MLWGDQLAKNPYRPPFEALNGKKLLVLDEGLFRRDDSQVWRDIRVNAYWT